MSTRVHDDIPDDEMTGDPSGVAPLDYTDCVWAASDALLDARRVCRTNPADQRAARLAALELAENLIADAKEFLK